MTLCALYEKGVYLEGSILMGALSKRANLVRYLWIISALVATAAVIIFYLALPFVFEFDSLL